MRYGKLVALMILVPALGWAVEDSEFHWKGRVAAEKTVVVRALNGSVEVTGTSGDEVEVTAVKHGPNAEFMNVKVIPTDEGLLVCETYDHDGDVEDTCSEHSRSHNHGRMPSADYTIRIPQNLRLRASTVNGGVAAEKLGRYAEVSSVNGGVSVSTAQWAKASSVNGSVSASFGKAGWDSLKLSSVNGSIEVVLPSDVSTDVRFRSVNGHLDSDFPVTVQGRRGRGSMEGRIGSGGRELDLETVNGSVQLRKTSF